MKQATHHKNTIQKTLLTKYQKLRKRLEKAIQNGQFFKQSYQRQQQLIARLLRYSRRLKINTSLQKGLLIALMGLNSSTIAPIIGQSYPAICVETRVNTETNDVQNAASIAMDSEGNYVIAWTSEDQDGSDTGVYMQRYNRQGIAQGSETRVNTETDNHQNRVSVAMDDDGDFVAVWASYEQDGSSSGVFMQRYNQEGVVQGLETQVNTETNFSQTTPSVAMDSDGDFVVVWRSSNQDGALGGVYMKRYNNDGTLQSGETKVNTTTLNNQHNPDVAIDSDGDFVVVWESYDQDGSQGGIYMQRYNKTGFKLGTETPVNTETNNAQSFPSVAMDNDGDFVVVWQSSNQDGFDSGIYMQRYDQSGIAQGIETLVNTYVYYSQTGAEVAMNDDGDFVVTWSSRNQDGFAGGVYMQRFNEIGVPQAHETLVNTETNSSQTRPSIAMDSDGDFVITWSSIYQEGDSYYGVYMQRYSLPFSPQGIETQVNTETSSMQSNPAIALDNDGDYVITWQSIGQDGSSYGVFMQRYNNSGTPLGVETQVNTETNAFQGNSVVVMDTEGNYIVVWQSTHQDGSVQGVYMRRYNSLGAPLGPETLVNTETNDAQSNPAVAIDGNGNFIIVWSSAEQDGSGSGVYMQRYNSLGQTQGVETQVNTEANGNQSRPDIAMDSDGDFVVVWESEGQDGSEYGIYMQRYNSLGMTQGAETQVNTEIIDDQRRAKVAMDRDGNFVVAWDSYENDGFAYGIFMQRYNKEGIRLGDETQVNTTTLNSQTSPTIDTDELGNFVVAWESINQDGSYGGVYMQRYTSGGTAQSPETQVNTTIIDNQNSPTLALDSDGDFVVAWTSNNQDGSFKGVYMQRYTVPKNDYCPCEQNLVDLKGVIYPGEFKAIMKLEADGVIENGSDVDVQAGESISLNGGFTVEEGASFYAHIDDCLPTMSLQNTETTDQTPALELHDAALQHQSLELHIQPNPFQNETKLSLQLTENETINIQLLDYAGRKIKSITRSILLEKGTHDFYLNSENLRNGLFYIVVQTSKESVVKKVVVMKN